MSFLKAFGVQKYIIKNALTGLSGLGNDILRHTPVYFLMSCSPAEPISAFTGNGKSKPISGLRKQCQLILGLTTKKCQLFSGRYRIKK